MKKVIVGLLCIMLVFSSFPCLFASAQTKGSVIREVSDSCPDPGEIITVTVWPIGIGSFYAVEEHLGFLRYTGEHTADSNPEGTVFNNLTPRSFTYKVRVPMDEDTHNLPSGVGRLSITGEFWTDPDDKKAIGETTLCGPTVSISPSFQQVRPSESFSVALDIEPAGRGVSAASVVLSFDPVIMRVDGAAMGNFLGENAIFAPGFPQIDNTEGTVKIDAARIGATSVPSTRGTLATITLTANTETQIQQRASEPSSKTDKGIPAGLWYTGLKDTEPTGTLRVSFGTSKLVFTGAQLVDENARDIAEVSTVDGAVSLLRAQEIVPEQPDLEDEERIGSGASETGECPRWDINQDCIVNHEDLGILGEVYNKAPQPDYPRSDINEDLIVDLKDLSLLVAHYYETVCECSPDMWEDIDEMLWSIISEAVPDWGNFPTPE